MKLLPARICLPVLAALAFILAACGPGAASSTPPPAATAVPR